MINNNQSYSHKMAFSMHSDRTAYGKYIHVLVKMSSKKILIRWNLAKADSSGKYVTVFLRANAYD